MPLAPRLLLLTAASSALAGCGGVGRAPGVAAGFVSHQLCSGVFVSGQDPDAYYSQAIAPSLSVADPLVHRAVDQVNSEVTASFAGLATRRAVYRGATGCVLQSAGDPGPTVAALPPPAASLIPPIAGPAVVEPADPALNAALDHAFAEPDRPPHRWTKAVVIVQDGRVVAERYATGYGVDTPIHGWSMTKSVTNALVGVLVREGRLDIHAPAPVAAWASPSDPRHAITADSMLRMASGLDMGQSLTDGFGEAFDPTAHMVFDTHDMAAFAEAAPTIAPPGGKWRYANGNYLVLSQIIRDRAGGDAASTLRFIHAELFDKLGMSHATLEFDGAGTPIGASHMWAPARDWARFGMLYLNDGVVGGQRILPAGWVDYSARLTPGSEDYGYGAGFWTNRGRSQAAKRRIAAGMPADSFMARGSQGQAIVVIPSLRLVIVRLGMSYTPSGDIVALERLVADTVAAVKARPAA
jgi:hypothetical protein